MSFGLHLSDIDPRNPHRPPEWRWQRAQTLFIHGKRPDRHKDDEMTKRAFHYTAASAKDLKDEVDVKDAGLSADPDIHFARSIWDKGAKFPDFDKDAMAYESDMMRSQVEARLLAGQEPDEIARMSRTTADVVQAYHDVFYEVMPHIESKDWIVREAIGPQAYNGCKAPKLHIGQRYPRTDIGIYWRLVGYALGPFVLEEVMGTTASVGKPRSAEQVPATLEMSAVNGVRKMANQAAMCLRVEDNHALEVLELFSGMYKTERETRSENTNNSLMDGIMKAVAIYGVNFSKAIAGAEAPVIVPMEARYPVLMGPS
jgi:hypothetical protein